jgi:hypothetical protein
VIMCDARDRQSATAALVALVRHLVAAAPPAPASPDAAPAAPEPAAPAPARPETVQSAPAR